ncbi:MAG: mechanosensitive ion channel domain-containing protein [Gemmatimonadota bacterium]
MPPIRRGPRRRAVRGAWSRRGGRARLRRRVGRGKRPGATDRARAGLRRFRGATIVAVAITAFFILLLTPPDEAAGDAQTGAAPAVQQTPQDTAPTDLPDTVSIIENIPVEDLQSGQEPTAEPEAVRADTLVQAAREEAERTARRLWFGFLGNLPKFLVAGGVLLLAWLTVRLLRPLLNRVLREWERAQATTALIGIAVWLLAIGIAVSVIAGDIRALVGSLGLVGLALSWALQTPIESFTGWLLNSFQGYYRVGDRVAVGEVFGDVFRIDFLTTTVWEIGSLERPGFVQAEQPTGRLITFPNSEVLAGSIVNLTRDFPYVWDELTIPVADQSDLTYAAALLRRVASEHLADYMERPTAAYETILRSAGLEAAVSRVPEVYIAAGDARVDLTARYLVGARERRRWKSELAAAVLTEFDRPEHVGKIVAAFPRQQIQLLDAEGRPRD